MGFLKFRLSTTGVSLILDKVEIFKSQVGFVLFSFFLT